MLATRTSHAATCLAPVFEVDAIPWTLPYNPGASPLPKNGLEPGHYTLEGKVSGKAEVILLADSTGRISGVSAKDKEYSDDGKHIINERNTVTNTMLTSNIWENNIEWYSDLLGTGDVNASKKTRKDGFHLQIEVMVNNVQATGKLSTTINGVSYEPLMSGTMSYALHCNGKLVWQWYLKRRVIARHPLLHQNCAPDHQQAVP